MSTLPTIRGALRKEAFTRGVEGLTAQSLLSAELQPTGIVEVDALLGGGLSRGSVVELCGPSSSGKTGLCFSLLAQATQRQQACAYVDVSDTVDPSSLAAAGLDIARLLWVRCAEDESGKGSEPQISVSAATHAKKAIGGRDDFSPSAKSRETCQTSRGFRHPRDQIRGIETSIPQIVGNGMNGRRGTNSRNGPPSPSTSNTEDVEVVARCAGEQTERDREIPRRGENVRERRFRDDGTQHVSQPIARERTSSRGKPWKRLEQALKTTDLLLHSGGWGIVVLDFGSISWVDVRQIPMSTWYRFQRIIENTPTILVLLGEETSAKGCASVALQCRRKHDKWRRVVSSNTRAGIAILQGFEVEGEVVRCRRREERADATRWQTRSQSARKSQKP
jgi:recombination protein RecA